MSSFERATISGITKVVAVFCQFETMKSRLPLTACLYGKSYTIQDDISEIAKSTGDLIALKYETILPDLTVAHLLDWAVIHWIIDSFLQGSAREISFRQTAML
jgi:hypothetical protein